MRSFTDRVASLFGRAGARAGHHPRRAKKCRLAVTRLEERDVPATFYVTNGGDNGGVDPAAFAGTGTLRQAVVDAQQILADGDEIVIDDLVTMIVLEDELQPFVESHTIRTEFYGPTEPQVMIVPATEHTYRVADVVINGASLTLRNLYFENFGTSSSGGAIRAAGVVEMTDCTFIDNHAGTDGGAFATGGAAIGHLTLDRCEFIDNEAGDDGGAVYSYASGTAPQIFITESLFESNLAGGDGGAIFFTSAIGFLSVLDSNISYNTAGGNGGGIYQYGGALDSAATTHTVDTSFMTNNSAGGNGGAIFYEVGSGGGGVTITETQIFQNSAASGGALYQVGGYIEMFHHPFGVTRLDVYLNSGGPGAVTVLNPTSVSIDSTMWNPACPWDVHITVFPGMAPPISVNTSRLLIGLNVVFL
jgi:predicted outer membrane repeat protein